MAGPDCGHATARVDLRGANLHSADLPGADLFNAKLGEADLRDADLVGAFLYDANLWEADLRDADLTGADLREADLTRAWLNGDTNVFAVVWGNTTCPDHTNSDDHEGTCEGHLFPQRRGRFRGGP